MKLNYTFAAVALFVVLLIAAASNANGEDGARIALGHTAANSELPMGEIGYEHRGWELAASQIGEGDTKRGEQDTVPIYSLSHVVRPSWRFLGATNYYRIGVAYVDGSPLVGDTNFRLGIGLEWKVMQLEYFHYSSAGIHETNTGIDGVQLRLLIP